MKINTKQLAENARSEELQPVDKDKQTQQTKSELLSALMSQPETYNLIGASWRLFMKLITTKDGVLIGIQRNIAEQLGIESKDTVGNWIEHLVSEGIIEVKKEGWQMTLTLIGKYMEIARAPERILEVSQVLPPESPAFSSLRKITDGANELNGEMTITIQTRIR